MNIQAPTLQVVGGIVCPPLTTFYSLVLTCALISSGVYAQGSWPTVFTLSQSSFSDGDTIFLDVSMGTVEQQVPTQESHTIVYSYANEDFAINPNSPFSLVAAANSFLLSDEHWSWSVSIDEEAQTLTIDLDRTDTQPFPSGYGAVLRLSGIIITIEEVNLRRTNPLQSHKRQTRIFPNPAKHYFRVQASTPIIEAQFLDLQGKVYETWKGNEQDKSFVVSHLPTGMYLIRLRYSDGDRTTHRIHLIR